VRFAVIVLAACGGSPRAAPVAPAEPAPKRDLAVAEPVPKQPEPPEFDPNACRVGAPCILPRRDVLLLRGPRSAVRMPRRVIALDGQLDVAPSDLWSPCVKKHVQEQGADARRAWTALFARYVPSCDAHHRMRIDPPREYAGKPYVALRGVVGGELVVEVASCTASSAERIVIAYDDQRWTAPLHESEQRAGCIVVRVPDTRTARRVLRNALDASRASVQLDGDEIAITDELKRDLRLVLDATDGP
jgi:hypothetical protein